MNTSKRVVILGGGCGGVYKQNISTVVVRGLVILLSQQNHTVFSDDDCK